MNRFPCEKRIHSYGTSLAKDNPIGSRPEIPSTKSFLLYTTLPLLLIMMTLTTPLKAQAAKPNLRDQVLLNGQWDQGGNVPNYTGESFDSKTYQRTVTVPTEWQGRIVHLHFNAINYIAEIFINSNKVQTHVGGWVPFDVDITRHVKAGEPFELKVVVTSRMAQPYLDANGKPAWPIGDIWTKGGDTMWSGIVDDVYLYAYGPVHLTDTYIQTSWRNKEITLVHQIINETGKNKTVQIQNKILSSATGHVELEVPASTVNLAPGERKEVVVNSRWENPTPWWPDEPNLYHLQTSIVEDKEIVDAETRRFGFREIWIEGNQFKVNGIRVNFRGDFVEYAQDLPLSKFSRENWSKVIDDLKGLNINTFRHHKYPAPQFCYDLADEKGLFIISESAINGDVKGFFEGYNPDLFFKNTKTWIQEWVTGSRNHPCIVLWSAVNEMFFAKITEAQCKELNDDIRAFDTTRPIIFCGEKGKGPETVDYHYPHATGSISVVHDEPWDWEKGIYGWSTFIDQKRPTCASECMNVPGRAEPKHGEERNKWWHGIFTRGMRYNGFALISPGEAYNWMVKENDFDGIRVVNYRNAYNPIALFDYDYGNLGLTPFVTDLKAPGTLPTVDEGSVQKRKLILYNDDFRGEKITVEVQITVGGNVFAKGEKTFDVPLGEHLEIPCEFQVPYLGGTILDLVLITRKDEKERFRESNQFSIVDRGLDGTSSPKVSFDISNVNK